ncbi:MAG: putative Fe-S cluster assembly protein SufT [Opitutaceae bacterium]
MTKEIPLLRDTEATAIPAGTVVRLPSGTPVFVTQTLGGNITVRSDRGLFRIDARDRDALGEAFADETAGDDVAHDSFSEEAVWNALKGCYDPEIPVNIVDLGLVYDLVVEPGETAGKHKVAVKMTLTAPGCGMGPVIANDAKGRIESLTAVEEANVAIVWDPVWTPQMISEEGRKVLGLE